MPISNNDNLIEQEFQLEKGLFYLNHAAVSPWPKRTRDIVTAFAEENFSLGSWHYPRWPSTPPAGGWPKKAKSKKT